MLERLFPRSANNDFRGHPAALWLLAAIAVVTWVRSLIHLFRADGGAQSIATIPLDQYTPEGAAAVVMVFALWGRSQLLLAAVLTLVLWRYRNLVPLMYLLLFAEYAGRLLIGIWKPVETLSRPPGAVANMVFPVLSAGMLWLSTRTRRPTATG